MVAVAASRVGPDMVAVARSGVGTDLVAVAASRVGPDMVAVARKLLIINKMSNLRPPKKEDGDTLNC